MIRVAIVGIGFGQAAHLPAFRMDTRALVHGVCASTPERARAVAERHGIAVAYADWRAAIADEEVHALALAVPPDVQQEILPAALAAGKHVFCEKPLGVAVAALEPLPELARARGLAALVNFWQPELATWRAATAAFASGRLGELKSVEVSWHVLTRAHATAEDSWKTNDVHGGGCLHAFGSHLLHNIESLVGPLARVAARRLYRGRADTGLHLWGELAGGAPLAAALTTDAFGGTGHRIAIYGEAGRLVLENPGPDHALGFTLDLGLADGTTERTGGDDRAGRVECTARLVARFLDWASGGRPARPDLADGLRAQRLIAACTASGGGWVVP